MVGPSLKSQLAGQLTSSSQKSALTRALGIEQVGFQPSGVIAAGSKEIAYKKYLGNEQRMAEMAQFKSAERAIGTLGKKLNATFLGLGLSMMFIAGGISKSLTNLLNPAKDVVKIGEIISTILTILFLPLMLLILPFLLQVLDFVIKLSSESPQLLILLGILVLLAAGFFMLVSWVGQVLIVLSAILPLLAAVAGLLGLPVFVVILVLIGVIVTTLITLGVVLVIAAALLSNLVLLFYYFRDAMNSAFDALEALFPQYAKSIDFIQAILNTITDWAVRFGLLPKLDGASGWKEQVVADSLSKNKQDNVGGGPSTYNDGRYGSMINIGQYNAGGGKTAYTIDELVAMNASLSSSK